MSPPGRSGSGTAGDNNWREQPYCDPHFISRHAVAAEHLGASVHRASGFVQTVISYTGPTRAICRLPGDRVLGPPETITGGNSPIVQQPDRSWSTPSTEINS